MAARDPRPPSYETPPAFGPPAGFTLPGGPKLSVPPPEVRTAGVLWLAFAAVALFLPLGIVALILTRLARAADDRGDVALARRRAAQARAAGLAAVLVGTATWAFALWSRS
jgi:hypothetical protein